MSIFTNNLICGDCIEVMKDMDDESVGLVVTSPPYNLSLPYSSYNDNRSDYEDWCIQWLDQIYRVLNDAGSFFLNIAGSSASTLIPYRMLMQCIDMGFVLQNNFVWIKSIYIPEVGEEGHTFGHFKPTNSHRYVNRTHESIFHLTKTGDVTLHRKAIGVPYSDKSNEKRWKSSSNVRCRGNTWFIPYNTRQSTDDHPAKFPIDLPLMCIDLHFGTEKDGLVLDPFVGSGTTVKAAQMRMLDAIGIDVDQTYIDRAKENQDDLQTR